MGGWVLISILLVPVVLNNFNGLDLIDKQVNITLTANTDHSLGCADYGCSSAQRKGCGLIVLVSFPTEGVRKNKLR